MSGKRTTSRYANATLVLLLASCVLLAQTAKSGPPSVTKTSPAPTVEKSRSEADVLREHQLRVLRETVLTRTVDNIKKMDEAGLRISARNQLLAYLSSEKPPSDARQTVATQIARDALTDLREHSDAISPFMLGYLSSDLGSWIQKNGPTLIQEFEKTIQSTANVDASQRIRSLFEQEGGESLAVRQIRQELIEGGPLNGLNFWLDELIRRNSKEFEPLAFEILTQAVQGHVAFETLFWISGAYLRPQSPNTLKVRFLTTVVARTEPANFVGEPAPQIAYDLLTRSLPAIQQTTPELYDQAVNQSFAIKASLNERQLASEARIRRLRESTNPIADLKSEADAAKTKSERNELLLQAAQLALERRKLDSCLDIASEVDVNIPAADPGLWQRSIDQLLKNVARAALTAKLPEVAEKAAGRIVATLTKVEALALTMRYYTKAKDKETAQRLLIEASKVAASGADDADKLKAFLLLSITCDEVEPSKKAELLLSGIKALNNLPKPDADARDKTTYQTYVQRLDNTGYELTKAFKGVTQQDENSALALVERLQQSDLRTFALLGILLGLDQLPPTSTKAQIQ